VALILVLVGFKMVASYWVHPPIGISLGGIVLILTVSVAASLIHARRAKAAARE
jgi:predicted tellurium resistance membrane protein TerC